jgi:hypothetical protein
MNLGQLDCRVAAAEKLALYSPKGWARVYWQGVYNALYRRRRAMVLLA